MRSTSPSGRTPIKVPTQLTVYSRNDCQLCEDMIQELNALTERFRFAVDIVDVDSQPALEARYGTHVPVLMHEARELCRHRFDIALVTDYLVKIG